MGATRPAVPITRFAGRYRFLSNLYLSRVEMDGLIYPSVEHAYQAAKALNLPDRRRIRNAPTAGVAKRLGRKVAVRPNWDASRQSIMLTLLESKFSDPDLAKRLLATYPSPLIAGNTRGNTYWGVDLRTGEGMNTLGKLLHIVREKLRRGHGRDASETREKARERLRAWRREKAEERRRANEGKALVPLPALPWAWSKSKSREPLRRTEPGREVHGGWKEKGRGGRKKR